MDNFEVQSVPGGGANMPSSTLPLDAAMLFWLALVHFVLSADIGAMLALNCDFLETTGTADCSFPAHSVLLFFVFGLVAYFIFGFLAATKERLLVLFAALLIWIVGNLAAGFSEDNDALWYSRTFIAIGFAGYATVAIPLVNDLAPENANARWIATLVIVSNGGVFAGALLGQQVHETEGNLFWVFRVLALVMVPLALLSLLPFFALRVAAIQIAEELAAKAAAAASVDTGNMFSLSGAKNLVAKAEDAADGPPSFGELVSQLFASSAYVLTTIGFLVYFLAIGSINIYLADFLEVTFPEASTEDIVINVGYIVMVSLLAGPLIAGIAYDFQASSLEGDVGKKQRAELALSNSKWFAFAALATGVSALWVPDYSISSILLGTSQVFAMGCLVTVIVAVLNCVPHSLKSVSIAFSFSAIAIFRLVIAPWVIAYFATGYGYQIALTVASLAFLFSGIFWTVAAGKVEDIKN